MGNGGKDKQTTPIPVIAYGSIDIEVGQDLKLELILFLVASDKHW